jgi:serine phosphatase RsbU (regulator of sigma subunit)
MSAMETPGHDVHCAEVHGGNLPVDHSLVLPDLDIWLYSRPQGGDGEGGDLVFVSVCEMGAISKAYLADVAGHGETVAPRARSLQELIRRHLDDHDHQAFFRALNDGVGAGVFATMVAVSYDRPGSRLVYAYAGHPHLLFHSARTGEFVSLEPDYCTIPGRPADLAIGVVEETTWFQSTIGFLPGDMAILYSDGWTEAKAPDGSRPGLDGLLSVANRCSTASAWSFRQDILHLYRQDLLIETFGDDLSLVVMKRIGPP